MERLTRRNKDGEVLPVNHLNIRHEDTTSESTLIEIMEVLAAYEDIGPTPEQLLEIDKMYSDMCREVAELREKQTPYKPDEYKGTAWNGVGVCKCEVVFLDRTTNYCGNCGQRLNWGD